MQYTIVIMEHFINIDSRLRQVDDKISYLGSTNISSISFVKGMDVICLRVNDPSLIQLDSSVMLNGLMLPTVTLRTIDDHDHQIIYHDGNNLIIEVSNSLIPYCSPGGQVKVCIDLGDLLENKEWCGVVLNNCIKLTVGQINGRITERNFTVQFKTVCGIDIKRITSTIFQVVKIDGNCISLKAKFKPDSTFTVNTECGVLNIIDNIVFGYSTPSSYRIKLPVVFTDVLSISLTNTVFQEPLRDYVYMNLNNLDNLQSLGSSRHFAKILPGDPVDNFVCNKIMYDEVISQFGEVDVSFDKFNDEPDTTVDEHSFVLQIITLETPAN